MYGMSNPGGEWEEKNLDRAGKQLYKELSKFKVGHTCLKSIEEATITSGREVMNVS